MASTHFFGRMGIICGLYIDGRLIGEIMSKHGFWSRSLEKRDSKFGENAAEAALYEVCRVLTGLRYFLGLDKCILSPATRVDNQVTISFWHGRGPKSLRLSRAARLLFEKKLKERNLMLEVSYIPPGLNPADYYSRKLTRSARF